MSHDNTAIAARLELARDIAREAGGTFTDWQGESTIHRGEGVATNGRILDEVMQTLRSS